MPEAQVGPRTFSFWNRLSKAVRTETGSWLMLENSTSLRLGGDCASRPGKRIQMGVRVEGRELELELTGFFSKLLREEEGGTYQPDAWAVTFRPRLSRHTPWVPAKVANGSATTSTHSLHSKDEACAPRPFSFLLLSTHTSFLTRTPVCVVEVWLFALAAVSLHLPSS